MSFATCTLRFVKQPDRSIYMSGSLIKSLQLTGTKNVTIKLGKQAITAPMKRLKKQGNLLYLPPSIRNELHVPRSGKIMIVANSAKEVRIGPLIGIITSGGSSSAGSPLGGRGAILRPYLNAGANKAFCFAFLAKDINWQNETVTGYFPGSNGSWQKRNVPLPDAVYNRLGSRSGDRSPLMEKLKERFTRRNTPIFNWSYFDKWDVYHLLQGDDMEKHVPESRIDPSPETIRDMLERHRFVYLKPTGGSLGIGIYRLTYHPKRGYFARFRRNGQNVLMRFAKFSGLMKLIHRKAGRLKRHVVQQGIRLIEIDGCPIDFRFHMNKNGNNQWVVAGIGAKKAGKGSVTTHVKNGGQVMTPEQVLRSVYGGRADTILHNAKQVAIKLAEAIEKNYKHRLGELGFDLGIDQKEKIWMFEANAKPGRSIFKHPSLKSQGKDSLDYIFDYCVYLGGFRARRD